MNRLQSQALSSGLKINKPLVPEAFWPLAFEKYITVNTFGKYSSRNYLYFTEVINIIQPYLKENNIHVVQLGTADDPPIHASIFGLNGVLSIPQSNYVIKNSSLHFGCDGFLNHAASSYDVPLVALYGDTLSSQAKPLWGNSKTQIHIDGSRGKIPSYAQSDGESQNINSIKPETAGKAILKLLNIKNNLNKYKTNFIGNMYHTPVVDIIPDHNPTSFPPNIQLNIRADYRFHLPFLQAWLQSRNNSLLTMNSEIPLQIIAPYRKNLKQINLEIDLDASEEYIDNLLGLGVSVNLLCKDKENIKSIRLKFINHIIHDTSPKKPPSKISKNIKNFKIKSSKELFSQGKSFPSKYHFYKSLNVDNIQYLWEDLDHLIFYSKK
jgi:hypothetical protein